jgi:hypothetical protein
METAQTTPIEGTTPVPQTSDAGPMRLAIQVSGGTVQPLQDGAPHSDTPLTVLLQANIEIVDFVHDGKHWRVNAFTIERDGALAPWPRNDADNGCRWVTPAGGRQTVEVVVVPVAYAWVGQLTDDGIDAFTDHDYAPCRVIVEVPDPVIERPTP